MFQKHFWLVLFIFSNSFYVFAQDDLQRAGSVPLHDPVKETPIQESPIEGVIPTQAARMMPVSDEAPSSPQVANKVVTFEKAQYPIQELKASFSKGTQTGYSILIADVNIDLVEKEWKQLLKKNKAKVKQKGGESFAENAILSEISSNEMDVYATFGVQSGNVEMITFFDIGEGEFVTSHTFPQKAEAAKQFLHNFALYVSEESVIQELEIAEKELNNQESQLKKLEKESETLHKNIKKWQDSIAEAEKRIEGNIIEQEQTTKAIEKQDAAVKKVREKLRIFR